MPVPNKPRRETLDELLKRYEAEEPLSFSEVEKIGVNTKGWEDWTTLHMAVTRCSDDTEASDDVATLLDAGADPNASSVIGTTPLHIAAAQGSLAVCKLLLDHGAKVDLENEYGEVPIKAAETMEHIEIVELLQGIVTKG